jgi:hypothetical protein
MKYIPDEWYKPKHKACRVYLWRVLATVREDFVNQIYMRSLKLRDPESQEDVDKKQITVCNEFAQLITDIPFSSSKLNLELAQLNHFYREERSCPESF